MKNALLIVTTILFSNLLISQIITKPRGCFAGSNGTNVAVLAHPEARGVLIAVHWSSIETSPGIFDFTSINSKIASITNANLKYSLAILGGSLGSPDWLIDSIGASYFNTTFQGQNARLPLWWDSLVLQRLGILITELGKQYSQDNSLSHIYVTQMTSNGIEGHLNGVDMNAFATRGFTNQNWINAAKSTTYMFAQAFPNIPIAFEVHEISGNTTVPTTIMNDLYNDPNLCGRVGLAMWWLSGKTSYQPNLIDFITSFKGDKYAQVIGRSDQVERFKDGLYSTIFDQAKNLGIRYIEPWPYEFQYHTYDNLLQNFNLWTDTTFSAVSNCSDLSTTDEINTFKSNVSFFPNPTSGPLNLKINFPYTNLNISIFSITGQKLMSINNQPNIDLTPLNEGTYFLMINIDESTETHKIIKLK